MDIKLSKKGDCWAAAIHAVDIESSVGKYLCGVRFGGNSSSEWDGDLTKVTCGECKAKLVLIESIEESTPYFMDEYIDDFYPEKELRNNE